MAKCPKNLKGWDELVKIMGNSRELAYEVVSLNEGVVPEASSPIIQEVKDFKLNVGKQLEEETDIDGNATGYYSVIGTDDKIRRTTDYKVGFLRGFDPRITAIDKRKAENTQENNDAKSYAEMEADIRYEGLNETDTLRNAFTLEKETKEEYIISLEKIMEHGRVKGVVMHKAIQSIFSPEKAAELDLEIQVELADYEHKYGGSSNIKWEWVKQKDNKGEYTILKTMLESLGVNTLTDIANPAETELLRDKVMSEVKLMNADLGFGGTIDMLVKKPSGRYSIVDFKTGARFNPTENSAGNVIMKYGSQATKEIMQNPMNKAKLQIVFYALMLKANNPGIKFDKLGVSWVPTSYDAENRNTDQNIDVSSFISMINELLQDPKAVKELNMPADVRAKLLASDHNIFNPSHYAETIPQDLVGELIANDTTPNSLITSKILELNALVGKGYASSKSENQKSELRSLDAKERADIAKLTKDILSLKAEGAVDLYGEMGESINAFTTYLGNFNDINNPLVQEWKHYYDKQQEKIRVKRIDLENKFHSLLKPLMDKEKVSAIGVRGHNNVSYDRLYGKFFIKTKSEDTGKVQERFLHENETDPELKQQYNNLSTNEKLFIDFVNNTFSEFFTPDAYINQKAYESNGISHTGMSSYNENKGDDKFSHYKGFFFKLPITQLEIKNRFGWGKVLRHFFRTNITYFVENNFEQEIGNQQFIPIKYLGNNYINNTELYTKDIERIFTGGIKSMLEKEHLDSVYSMGAGVSSILSEDQYGDDYSNLKTFIDLRLYGEIQGRKKRLKSSRRGIKSVKMYGKNKGTHNVIAVEKIPKMLQKLASMSIMWFHPISGLGNTVHATMLTQRDAVKGSITSKIKGFDTDSIDFTLKDIAKAEFEYKDLIKDTALGTIRKNKMLLMARKFNYFGNNFDYAIMDKFTMSDNFKYFNEGTAYLFHSVGEEFVSLTTMAAQMMHMKNKQTGKSLWESYDVVEVGPGIWDLEWKGGVRGTLKRGSGSTASYEDITELTTLEQGKLKRVHERLQGGYRKEESTNAEVYALGSFFLQFKKYLPRLIINLTHSKMESTQLGYYKQLFDKEGKPVYKDQNGKPIPVMEWHARVEEGRLRSLAKAVYSLSGARPEKMSDIEKENIVEAMTTMGFLGVALGLYFMLFGDSDDDDAAKKWWKMYMVDNLSQQYNVFELAKTMTTATTPVALTTTYKTTVSGAEFLWASAMWYGLGNQSGLTQKGDIRGWNQFRRGIPGVSSVVGVLDKIDKADPESWGTGIFSTANDNILLR